MDKKLQVIVLIFSIIGAIWAGVWALRDKIVFAGDLQMMQQQNQVTQEKNAMTLKMLQQEIQVSRFQNDIRFFETKLTILKDKYYNLKSYLRTNPNDTDARSDYNDIKKQIADVENQLHNLKLKDK